jgi:hypothetical protein
MSWWGKYQAICFGNKNNIEPPGRSGSARKFRECNGAVGAAPRILHISAVTVRFPSASSSVRPLMQASRVKQKML